MPDEDILAQFQEFLTAKAEHEKEQSSAEDFDVEIWDESGKGVRTRRSHAKPFLQSLGIDLDPEPESTDDNADKDKDKSKTKPVPTGKQSTNATSSSVARKYFAGKATPKK